MLLRILSESFIRRKRRKIVGIFAIALGSSLATALIGISIEIGDKMGKELKVYGSNLIIRPEGDTSQVLPLTKRRFLDEESLVKIKEIFWTNNIIGFAPFLSTWTEYEGRKVGLKGTWFDKEIKLSDGQRWLTGVKSLYPFWKVEGDWPQDAGHSSEALVGKDLADTMGIGVGQKIRLEKGNQNFEFIVKGLLSSGEAFDSEIIVGLDELQRLAQLPNRVEQVFVNALTSPEDELQKIYHRNPKTLSADEYERWSCTPYITTIAAQIKDMIPSSVVEPILEVAQREGVLLNKFKSLFIFICIMALLAAGFGLTSTLMATVAERRQEVGLLRAIGAGARDIVLIFVAELAVSALIGSFLGGGIGYFLGQIISLKIFQTSIQPNPIVIFVVAGVTLCIAIIGGLFPIRSALRLDPIKVLHES